MKRILWGMAMWAVASGVWAEDDRPVVQIRGRSANEQPLTVVTPQPPAGRAAPVVRSEAPAGGEVAVAPRVPVGGIVAWANSYTNLPALPPGWVPCNGQAIDDPDSPLLGQFAPDLNAVGGGEGRFLRGAPTSGGMGGSATHVHDGYRSQKYGTQRSPVAAPLPANHLPPYFDVVWIIRIK